MKTSIFKLAFLCIFISTVSYGQSITLDPNSPSRLNIKSTGLTYGNISTTSGAGADLIFKLSEPSFGNGAAGITKGIISTFPNRFQIGAEGSTTNLSLAINSVSRLTILPSGLVGVGIAIPTAKLHIKHLASSTSPHLLLESDGSSASHIRATSTGPGVWDNYFTTGSIAGANLVYWENSNFGTTPLILTGEGNAFIENKLDVTGFTKLGGGAPNIKMKKLSGTFDLSSNTMLSPRYIPHGVADVSKIISVSVLGQYVGSGGYVSNSFLTTNGYQFDYQVDGNNIIVTPKVGNCINLQGQNIKVVITYEE